MPLVIAFIITRESSVICRLHFRYKFSWYSIQNKHECVIDYVITRISKLKGVKPVIARGRINFEPNQRLRLY